MTRASRAGFRAALAARESAYRAEIAAILIERNESPTDAGSIARTAQVTSMTAHEAAFAGDLVRARSLAADTAMLADGLALRARTIAAGG